MSEFEPTPESGEGQRRWQEGTDTFGRVYEVLLGVSSPMAYGEIAELADCSSNAAKKHLDRLVEMGVAESSSGSRPATYERNEGYMEWQEASRIAGELSIDEILDRVAALEEELSAYESRFEAGEPGGVSVFDGETHESVHERMTAVTEWQSAIRDRRLYELARQLSQNDGRLLPA